MVAVKREAATGRILRSRHLEPGYDRTEIASNPALESGTCLQYSFEAP
jgi:hypothetical protein